MPENLPDEKFDELLKENGIRCAKCKAELTGTKRFNMMFRLGIGPQGDEAYLRPETCQGIFADIPYLFKTQRVKLPKGFAQFGKSFRNEIAPRQGVLRVREIYQAEIEVCFDPENVSLPKFEVASDFLLSISKGDVEPVPTKVSDAIAAGTVPNKLIGYYLYLVQSFYEEAIGIPKTDIRLRTLTDVEKAFYSKVAFDLEVRTSVGWLELVACNYRSDYDLKRHSEVSGTDYTVEDDGKKVLPHIFELSMGVDRSLYVILEKAYRSEKDSKGGERIYLVAEARHRADPGWHIPAGLEGRAGRGGRAALQRAAHGLRPVLRRVRLHREEVRQGGRGGRSVLRHGRLRHALEWRCDCQAEGRPVAGQDQQGQAGRVAEGPPLRARELTAEARIARSTRAPRRPWRGR